MILRDVSSAKSLMHECISTTISLIKIKKNRRGPKNTSLIDFQADAVPCSTTLCSQAFDSPCLNRKNPKLLVFTRFPVLVNEVDQENNVSGSTRSIFRHSRTLSLL